MSNTLTRRGIVAKRRTSTMSHDWSETNLPWAYTTTSLFTEDWPSDVTIVDIQTGSSDFFTNLNNTVNAAGGRVVVRLGTGIYRLNQFRMYGSSGIPTYAFGFFHPNLQGFLGQGPDKTIIQMDANSVSQAQLDHMATMTKASFSPLQMGLIRLDGTAASQVLVSGVTFRAADQQNLTTVADDVDIFVPQPAPHNGLVLYQNTHALIQYTRFQAAGRACLSQPPFETANVGSQYGTVSYKHCEFDGRRSADLDPAQPRRCGPVMVNNETYSLFEDCWMHHSNVSRYAANDENRDTQGQYIVRRVKIEHISEQRNIDSALNNGQSLGGWSDPSCFGWESTNGTITIDNCIVNQDNNQFQWQSAPPCHYGLTSVGSRNPQGGRLSIYNSVHNNNGWPQLQGFATFRVVPSTYWALDGWDTTLFVYNSSGTRMTPYHYTGSWPMSTAAITAAGITPETHFIIRSQ